MTGQYHSFLTARKVQARCTLGDEVVQHLGVYNPINRVKEKDAACYQRTLDFVNEKIIPRRLVLATIFLLIRRLRGLYEGISIAHNLHS